MNRNIILANIKLRSLGEIWESHFALVGKVGAEMLPGKMSVKDESGKIRAVCHTHSYGFDTYSTKMYDHDYLVTLHEIEQSITLSVKFGKKCITTIRIRMDYSDDPRADMIKCTGDLAVLESPLFLINRAITACMEAKS